jgi:hypothetical protein
MPLHPTYNNPCYIVTNDNPSDLRASYFYVGQTISRSQLVMHPLSAYTIITTMNSLVTHVASGNRQPIHTIAFFIGTRVGPCIWCDDD